MGHNFLEGGRKFDCCNEIILLEIFFTSTTSPSQYVSPYHSHRQVSLSWDRLANEEILALIYSVFHLGSGYFTNRMLFINAFVVLLSEEEGRNPSTTVSSSKTFWHVFFPIFLHIYNQTLPLLTAFPTLSWHTTANLWTRNTKPSTRKGGQNFNHSLFPLFQLLESQRICRKLNHTPLHC